MHHSVVVYELSMPHSEHEKQCQWSARGSLVSQKPIHLSLNGSSPGPPRSGSARSKMRSSRAHGSLVIGRSPLMAGGTYLYHTQSQCTRHSEKERATAVVGECVHCVRDGEGRVRASRGHVLPHRAVPLSARYSQVKSSQVKPCVARTSTRSRPMERAWSRGRPLAPRAACAHTPVRPSRSSRRPTGRASPSRTPRPRNRVCHCPAYARALPTPAARGPVQCTSSAR
jgi:hypothetical protein